MAAIYYAGAPHRGNTMRVIVIGMDGLDPGVTEKLMAAGKLPSFKKLADEGTFRRLATTVPPQSPVAWASFATGTNPGKHDVFDFLYRTPSTYMPDLALTSVMQPRFLSIGTRKFPLGKSKLRSYMKGPPFWEITSRNKIPTVILRCPLTFPPSKVYGKMLSGLGTPDIRGTQGTFSFYTTRKGLAEGTGGGKVIPVELNAGRITSSIFGPGERAGDTLSSIPLTITVHDTGVILHVQGAEYPVASGSWSPWIRVKFSVNAFSRANGICRFYVKSITPDFELYMSPVNFDPVDPPFPVSYPASFSRELAKEVGMYHTLGQSGDTWILNEGHVSDETAQEQYAQSVDEDEKILFNELKTFERGVFFFYFGISDTVQHMFSGRTADSGKTDPIEEIYLRMDAVLKKVMHSVDNNTMLVVLSDHGFGPFTRTVHINTWLKENGYIFLKNETGRSGEFFENVDWSRTRAYAVGLSGIYINQKSRERDGIVDPAEAKSLQREIAGKLASLADPVGGKRAVAKVYFASEQYHGPYAGNAPDLIIGFNPGWRASWQTALGGVPSTVFEDNRKRWQGDHIFDAAAVPGVLFVNRKIKDGPVRIIDIAPTILHALEQPVPPEMDGVSLY